MQPDLNEGFRLSPQQKRLWLLQSENVTSRVQCAVLIEGDLDDSLLQACLEQAVRRHEILRTTFLCPPGLTLPLQIIRPAGLRWDNVIDLRTLGAQDQSAKIEELFEEALRVPFDFENGPLLDASLFYLSSAKKMLLLGVPSLGADKRGLQNLIREVAHSYGTEAIDDEPVQYADASAYLNAILEDEDTEAGEEYWQRQLIDGETNVRFAFERPALDAHVFKLRTIRREISAGLFAALEERASEYQSTPSLFLLACWQVLLWRLTGQQKIVVGTSFSGRSFAELEPLPGLFERYLPVISSLESSLRFPQLLEQNLKLSAQHAEWQDHFSFERVWPVSDQETAPHFFSTCFDGDDRPCAFASNELTFSIVKQYSCVDRFGLKLACSFLAGKFAIEFHYDSQRFAETDIEILAEQFQTLLADVVERPESEIGELRILSNESRRRLLYQFNETTVDYSLDQHLDQLFEEQVERTPDNPAVIFGEQQLTYAELNARANQLAHYLRRIGIGPETLVGICLERSMELVIGLLGILKAGGAYVPLDPSYPAERLRLIIAEAGISVVLTAQRFSELLPMAEVQSICLDADWNDIARESPENPGSSTVPGNLAYVIYTSGSTGKPKGSMITHEGICNRLLWMQETYELNAEDGVLQKTPFTFDVSVWEFFWPLLRGARLVMARPGGQGNSRYLVEIIQREKITTMHFVPSMLAAFLEDSRVSECRSLRRVICSGEALPYELKERFGKRLKAELHNLYGPTEASVDVTYWNCASEMERPIVPIGRPIANTQIYVLDKNLEPVPIGVCGELYIGGVGLARGYLRRADLTAERFLPNPFEAAGTRIYRTGDLARYLADGNVEYLGRTDHQVKIRGFRIELGEIESALNEHPAVQNTVVVAREEKTGSKQLVAYVLPDQRRAGASSRELMVKELRERLEQSLPEYMVPTAFVLLSELPLTSSGKVDRRALPAPHAGKAEFVAPRDQTEKTLADLWCQVLGIERVSIHDNFFDLGGDSILSIQIANQASEAGIQLKPRQMYQHRTIADLAAILEVAPTIDIEQGLVNGPVPLTPIQHWFFEQQLAEPHHWNQAMLFEASGEVNPDVLEEALQHLVIHHDALRSRFVQTASGWQQFVLPPGHARLLTQVSFAKLADTERQRALEDFISNFQASLNLSKGELFRAALIEPGAGMKHRLFVVIHHLVIDIVSWGILLKSLELAYRQLSDGEAVKLAPKTTSYKKWAEGLVEYVRSAKLRRELPEWSAATRRKANAIPVDFPSGANTEASVQTLWVSLSAAETRKLLQEVPRAYHTMINDVLLTALAQAFASWTGSRSLLVDLENHGREEILAGADLSRTIGWFTCIFPLYLDLGKANTPAAALKTIKEQIRRTPNGGIGYGVLRYLGAEAQLNACPEAQISFNYLGRRQRPDEASLWTPVEGFLGPMHSGRALRRYLLEVVGGISKQGQLKIGWLYSENLHRHSTIQFFADGFIESLKVIIDHCASPQAGSHTPSDFLATNLSQRALDQLVAAYGQIED